MAAQLTQTPPVIALSKNAMPVVLLTDNITPLQAAIDIDVITTTGVAATDTLIISYNQVQHIFTFVPTPDTSGLQLPLPQAGQTPEDWCAVIAEHLRMYAPLSDDFLIQNTPLSMRLNWRTLSPLVLTASTTATAFTVTAHSVTRIVNVDNLSAKLSVHDADTHETLLLLNGSYNTQTRDCAFDIRTAFADVRPHLPNEFDVPPNTVFIGYQRAYNAFRRYYIRYADNYGSPPKPERLQRSPNFTVIQGGVSSGRVADFFFHQVVALHNYFSPELGVPFTKSVTIEQPDWLYFVCPDDQTGLKMEYAVTYSSGEERFFDEGTFNITAGEVRIIPTGFKQFSLRNILTSPHDPTGLYPVSYEFRIRLSDGTTALRLTYELELFAAWNMYILLDNGIGGMESVRLKGKKSKMYEGESIIIEKNDGEMSTIFPEGFTRWEASTGWYEDYQAEHLAQLLLGKIWLIDPSDPLNPTFTPVIAEKQSFTFEDDEDKGMTALNFKFRIAKNTTQFNRF